jgi:hypothetical protein
LLLLTRGGQSTLDFRLQAGQPPDQAFPFLVCGGQLLFEFSGRRVNARLESLYQVLPEMPEDGHRNDLRWSNAAVIIWISSLLSFRVRYRTASPGAVLKNPAPTSYRQIYDNQLCFPADPPRL